MRLLDLAPLLLPPLQQALPPQAQAQVPQGRPDSVDGTGDWDWDWGILVKSRLPRAQLARCLCLRLLQALRA